MQLNVQFSRAGAKRNHEDNSDYSPWWHIFLSAFTEPQDQQRGLKMIHHTKGWFVDVTSQTQQIFPHNKVQWEGLFMVIKLRTSLQVLRLSWHLLISFSKFSPRTRKCRVAGSFVTVFRSTTAQPSGGHPQTCHRKSFSSFNKTF